MTGTILFVDDEAEMRFIASNYFRHHGYGVVTAENADEALRLADGIPINVTVLDVNLAGEDGVRLMAFLRRHHPRVPVILYTGMQHDEETVQKMLCNGANQYISKTAPMEELLKAVKSAWR
jgi:DNA-binding response OmpR family regulator